MAKVAAKTLTGVEATFHAVEMATQLKVTGVSLYSAGDFADAPDREEIVLRNAGAGIYKRLVLKDNRIVGVVLYGETTDGAWYFDMLRKGTDVLEMRETLIWLAISRKLSLILSRFTMSMGPPKPQWDA
jgi:nitrite reductase (NADH) large subunit